LAVDTTGPDPAGLDGEIVLTPEHRDRHQPDREEPLRTTHRLDPQRRRSGFFGNHEVGDFGFECPTDSIPEGNDPERTSAVPAKPSQELQPTPPVGLDPLPARFGVGLKVAGGGQSDAELPPEPVRRRQKPLVPAMQAIEGAA